MWFLKNKPIAYLSEAQVRFVEILLGRNYSLAEQALEAVVQAQDQLQYDEAYDVLAFACSKSCGNASPAQSLVPEQRNAIRLRIAVSTKLAVAQAAPAKDHRVGYLYEGQLLCLRPDWHTLRRQKRRVFLSLSLFFLVVPGLAGWGWAQTERTYLEERLADLHYAEEVQAQKTALQRQAQVLIQRLQVAQQNWAALMQSLEDLEQKMPANVAVQQVEWRVKRLQIQGRLIPAYAQASYVLAALWPNASFVMDAASVAQSGGQPLAFKIVRTW